MDIKEFKKKLSVAIGDNLDDAYKILDDNLSDNSRLYTMFLVSRSNWERIKKDINLGTLDKYSPEGQQAINKVCNTLINIAFEAIETDIQKDNNADITHEKDEKSNLKNIKSAIDEVFKETFKKEIDESKIFYGYNNLDKATSLKRKTVTLIGSSTGMGKTSFILNVVLSICKQRTRVLFYSLDESVVKITKRLIALHIPEESENLLRSEYLTVKNLNLFEEQISLLQDLPIAFSEGPFSLEELVLNIKQNFSSTKFDIVIVDSLDHIKNTNSEKNDILKAIKALNLLSKELNVSIVLLFNIENGKLSAKNYYRPNKNNIEWWSDKIGTHINELIFIYRPAYYGINEDKNGNSLLNVVEIILSRYSEVSLSLKFDPKSYRFVEWNL